MSVASSSSASAALKRKRSEAILNQLRPSEGFRNAAKSRTALPDELLSNDEDDDDEDVEESPSKRKSALRRSTKASAKASATRSDDDDVPASPTKSRAKAKALPKPKPPPQQTKTPTESPVKKAPALIFLTSADPRLTRKASGRKSLPSPTKTSAKGKEKEKPADELQTPIRTPRRKKGLSLSSEGDDDGGLDESPSKNRSARKKKTEPELLVDEDEEEQESDEEEAGSSEEQDEDDEDDIAVSPSKLSPSKKKKKSRSEPVSVLHVPGFVTQSAFDVYFQQISIPARTSSNTFTSLLPTLSLQEYVDLLDATPSQTKHQAELENLVQSHVDLFPRYLCELQAGFNLLFYGFGSKRNVLNRFASESCAKHGDVVVLNGYRPGIGVKELLERIESLRRRDDNSDLRANAALSALDLRAQRIYQTYHHTPRPLFLLVHNIDSPALRTVKAKAVLSLLASHPRIHLIGSVDHINAPLIWTQGEASGRGHQDSGSHTHSDPAVPETIPVERNFTWVWHDLTTFEHYDVELRAGRQRDLTSVTVQARAKLGVATGAAVGGPAATAGPLTEVGAQQVLTSVTERSRKVFALLADRQLGNIDAETEAEKAPNVVAAQMSRYAISYDSLVSAAREGFIATNEQALRGLLGEFKDHGMVAMGVVGGGGGEMIWIPLARNVLQRLTEASSTDQ